MRRRALVLVAVAGLLTAAPAGAHPGRLDREGCHQVRTRFIYQNGMVAETGTRHCHRALGEGLRLDGQELLEDTPVEQCERPEEPVATPFTCTAGIPTRCTPLTPEAP